MATIARANTTQWSKIDYNIISLLDVYLLLILLIICSQARYPSFYHQYRAKEIFVAV